MIAFDSAIEECFPGDPIAQLVCDTQVNRGVELADALTVAGQYQYEHFGVMVDYVEVELPIEKRGDGWR